ncbi:hypothetical protein, partial [Streptococcus suis]|uniref:hypothetical protein n=1 Tax=Streptococcus suis TaxID=1307 RepID=UPI0019D3490F
RRWRETAYSRCTSHPFSRVVMTVQSLRAQGKTFVFFEYFLSIFCCKRLFTGYFFDKIIQYK